MDIFQGLRHTHCELSDYGPHHKRLPSLRGFKYTPYNDIRSLAGIFTAGTIVSRYILDDGPLQVILGFGYSLTDHQALLRGLVIHHEVDYGPNVRLALEGNVLSPLLDNKSGYLLRDYESKKESYVGAVRQGTLLVNLIRGFEKHGALTNGAHANVAAFHHMFETGLIDQLVTGILRGNPEAAIEAVNPNSLELVPDLDYEIGLGIEPEPDPTTVEQEPTETVIDMIETELLEEPVPKPSLSNVSVGDLVDMLTIIDYLRTYGSEEMASAMEAIHSNPYAIGVSRKTKNVSLLVTGYKHDPGDNCEPTLGSQYASLMYYRPASFNVPKKGHIDTRSSIPLVRPVGAILIGPTLTTTLNGSVDHHPDYFGMSSLGHWAGG